MLKRRLVIQGLIVLCVVICPKSALSMVIRAMSSFQAGQDGWQMGTIAVGNVDGDSKLEIIVPYRDTAGARTVWYLDAFKADGNRLSGFPYAGGEEPINVSPTLYDLDGDGRAEILFTCGNKVVALRGNGTLFWSTPISYQNYVPDAGYQAVTNGFYWSSTGRWQARLPATAEFFSEVSSPVVVDANGNGSLKVVTAWKILPDATSTGQDYNPFIKPLFGFGDWGTVGETWSGGVVFLDAINGQKDFIYHFHQLVESGLGIGQARQDGAPLVYALNDSDSVAAFDKTKPYGLWGNGMLYKQFGKNQRLQSGSYLKGVDVYPVDIDGDGADEVLVPTTQLDPLWQPSETILDDDGAILWRKWKQPSDVPIAHGWLNNACMIPINPDHDNRIDVLSFTHSYEIAFRSWNGVELTDRSGWPKNFYPRVPTPPVVGDLDGDGQEEIVIGTYDPASVPSNGRLYIFGLDGTVKFSADVAGGLKHIPCLADVDADGSVDLTLRSLNGKVYVLNFGAASANRISWATHRGNVRRDGNRGVALFPEGTPIITHKESGYRRASFSWRTPTGYAPGGFQIFRADQAAGPFLQIAALPSSASSFTDSGLTDGWQYFYEVRTLYGTGIVASAPFAILSLLNNNLVVNGGFEENDNSHWDKWYTGEIPWENMIGSSVSPYQGKQCMEIKLLNNGNNSSIKQSNQYGTPDPAIRTSPGKLYSFGGFLRSGGISQPSEHWFEWNTTRTGENTNPIPSLPWPAYFTPHFVIGTTATPWIYLDRVFIMPAGFPNVELRHRYTIAAPGTGSIFIDNVFFRELPAPSDPRWQDLIPFRGTWSYTLAPPSNWYLESFDDSSWPKAPAKFGAGSGPQGIATPLPTKRPAYYFRRQFTAPDGPLQELLLAATATDDFQGRTYPLRVCINGREIGTSGIDAVSGDGNLVKLFDLTPFIDRIHAGVNSIAVILQNAWASDWDNVAFDLSLKVISSPPATGLAQFSSIQPNPDGTVTLRITGPAGSGWRVESADSPNSFSSWQKVQSLVIDPGNETTVTDLGKNGSARQNPEGTRFYRLMPE